MYADLRRRFSTDNVIVWKEPAAFRLTEQKNIKAEDTQITLNWQQQSIFHKVERINLILFNWIKSTYNKEPFAQIIHLKTTKTTIKLKKVHKIYKPTKNQKWHPQQRKKMQRVDTKTTPSKTETILNNTSFTNHLGNLEYELDDDEDDDDDDLENDHLFFHRPNLRNEPPLFFPTLLRRCMKPTLPSLPALFSITL